ncbi:hypothetical protein BGW38_005497, partial [Lunasporangiospora selenospora]
MNNSEEEGEFWSEVESKLNSTLASRKAGAITKVAEPQDAILDIVDVFDDVFGNTNRIKPVKISARKTGSFKKAVEPQDRIMDVGDVFDDVFSNTNRIKPVKMSARKTGSIKKAVEPQDMIMDVGDVFDNTNHIKSGRMLIHGRKSEEAEATITNMQEQSALESSSMSTRSKAQREFDLSSREERFAAMDQSQFWRLKSGRAVEEVLYQASLKQEANFKMQSYMIDFGCGKTKALFSEDEWEEMKVLDDFQLPKLPESTEGYIRDVRKALVRGKHVTTVPVPEEDRYSCELVLKSLLSWTQLYVTNPCPFDKDLPESFWSREGWPILKDLLWDVDGLTMIDDAKVILESGKRKNMRRKVDMGLTTSRKQTGRKLDLVARDTTNMRDWFIVENIKDWDEMSTNYLRELDMALFKDLHFIARRRLQDQYFVKFRSKARFFSVFSGGRGFKTVEMRAVPFSPYIMLVHLYYSFLLPTSVTTWKPQMQGLVHLLQVRNCVAETIKLYNALSNMETNEENEGGEESDGEWLYSHSSRRAFDEDLGSSPFMDYE